jgi:hypothetical protein
MPESFTTITLPVETKYITVGEAPRLMADARFPEIAGKEWEASTEPPPQEQWGTPELQGWGEPPREYLDREHLRRFYADKLDEAVQEGRIYRRCEVTWAKLEPGKPGLDQLLPVEEFRKFAEEFAMSIDMQARNHPRFGIEEMPPASIIEAAEKVARHFKERNIKDWKIGEIQSRQD